MSPDERTDHLAEIDRAECLRLLGEHGLGRIGVVVRDHPSIFPVNYVLLDDALFVCIQRGGDLDRATSDVLAALQIDGADAVYHEGWSVLAVGRSVHLTPSARSDRQIQHLGLSPWVGGNRSLIVRISIDEISGRRINHRVT